MDSGDRRWLNFRATSSDSKATCGGHCLDADINGWMDAGGLSGSCWSTGKFNLSLVVYIFVNWEILETVS